MIQQSSIGFRLVVGIVLALVITVSLAIFADLRLRFLAQQTETVCRHPLAVSSAVLEIDKRMIKIHRTMKDVVHEENPGHRQEFKACVDQYEQEIFEIFSVIEARFLGDPELHIKVKQSIHDWVNMCDEVFELMALDKRFEAAEITRHEGANQVDKIECELNHLREFALQNAQEINDKTQRSSTQAQFLINFFTVTGVVIYFVIGNLFVRSITAPLHKLQLLTVQVGKGNLDPVIESQPNNELGRLADSFGKMIHNLKAITTSRDAYEKELQTRVEVQQSLEASERRFRNTYNNVPCAIWENDFSRVTEAIEALRTQGVKDWQAYFRNHPKFVREAVGMVKVLRVNQAALDLHGVESEAELLGYNLGKTFCNDSFAMFSYQLIALAEGSRYFESEAKVMNLAGQEINVFLRVVFPPDDPTNASVLVAMNDISQVKRKEAIALRLGRIMDNSINETYLFHPVTYQFVDANKQALRSSQYKLGELIGLTPLDLLPDFDKNAFDALLKPLRHGRREFLVFRTRQRRMDGSIYPVEMFLQYLTSEVESMFAAIVLDVTEREQHERLIRKNTRRYKLLSACNGSLVRAENEQQFLETICMQILDVGGYELVWLGTVQADVLAPAAIHGDVDYCNTLAFRSAEGPATIAEMALARSDSYLISDFQEVDEAFPERDLALAKGYRSALACPLGRDGELNGVVCLYSRHVQEFDADEISFLEQLAVEMSFGIDYLRQEEKRHKQSLELADSQKKLASIVDTATDAIVSMDGQNQITTWNKHAMRMFGYGEDEAIGRNIFEMIPDLRHLNYQDRAKQPLNENHAGVVGQTTELKAIYRDGSEFPVELSISHWTSGGKNFYTSIIRDISVRKEIERKLLVAHGQLKESQARIILQEKMASIGLLAAGVAHEINNPVGFITGNLYTLEKYAKRLVDFIQLQDQALADQDEAAKQALAQHRKEMKIDYICEDIGASIAESLDGADRVKQIVVDMRSFSRFDKEEKPKATDVNALIDSVLNIVWNELKYKTEVKREYGDLPEVICYAQQLGQVVMNFLTNAAHAIEKRGQITITTWCDEEMAFIAIADTGSGIPENIQKEIFEPFFTTKKAGEGTGLGLSISQRIIDLHGGKIHLESQVGKGSTFTLEVPLACTGPFQPGQGNVVEKVRQIEKES